jgi:multidrug efflux pump subunit AcrA (membrane-fusion protein)
MSIDLEFDAPRVERAPAPRAKGSTTSSKPRRAWLPIGIAAFVILVVAIGAMMLSGGTSSTSGIKLTHTVARTDLIVTVTEEGELESAQNEDIKCEVAGGSTILWIIPDGTEVKEGDLLAKLDSATLQDSISQQQITYEKALATQIQAESDLAVAEINVDEYLEGTFRQEMQTAESNVAISEENLRSAQNVLEHSEKMFRKGYVSKLEMDSQYYAVEHAKLQLELHKTTVDVLERFTKPKMLQDLQSKLKAAKAKLASEKAALDLEMVRLKRLEKQRDGCEIRAKRAGMVIYPETEEWRDEPAIEEGSAVREQQTILQLPNLNDIQLRVDVHESKVEQLRAGMPARVRIQDRSYKGELASIANRAEQGSWWSGNLRQFRAIVKLLEHDNVKPGMSAEVEITVAHHKNVLTVPVAAVVEHDQDFHCWVKVGDQVQRRSLLLGDNNEQFIVVQDGLQEGDRVVLNPRAIVEEARLEALTPVIEAQATDTTATSSPK